MVLLSMTNFTVRRHVRFREFITAITLMTEHMEAQLFSSDLRGTPAKNCPVHLFNATVRLMPVLIIGNERESEPGRELEIITLY